MPRKSMTFGVLPSFSEVEESMYDKGAAPFTVRWNKKDLRTLHDARLAPLERMEPIELYDMLEILVRAFEDGDDSAGELVSTILAVLGFDWI